ncbi:hypothetical protein QTH97_28635 [Variovorax sp. J22R24]|nr:hypothetical protein [Variovorax sp. J22R24]
MPGFEPSGPGALDPVLSHRPASEASTRGAVVPVLPAETAAFWLKAGYWGIAMIVGFTLWCLYVTSKPGAPPLKSEIMSLLAPVMNAFPSSSAPVASTAPAPATAPAVADGVAPAVIPSGDATSPLHALLPGRGAAGSPAESSAQPAEQPAARTPPNARSETRPTARTSKGSAYASRARRERDDEPSVSVMAPPLERRSAEPDPGPPIAAGPGPLYDYSRLPPGSAPVAAGSNLAPSRQAIPDLGPPIAPGPGPRYDAVRAPPQVSSWPSNDPGPPIAVGPGPLVNYSTRGAGTR